MAHARGEPAVVTVAGGMLAVGGSGMLAVVPSTRDELYDEASGRWFELPHPMAEPRTSTQLVSLPAAALGTLGGALGAVLLLLHLAVYRHHTPLLPLGVLADLLLEVAIAAERLLRATATAAEAAAVGATLCAQAAALCAACAMLTQVLAPRAAEAPAAASKKRR